MAPQRFVKERKAREVTPYREEPPPASMIPLRPTTPRPDRQPSPLEADPRAVTPAPPEWSSYDAPINFTWVIPDELCGMGWPKSRDQVRFLVEQGIDHLVSLSPEKIPPHYAFPNLKHTLIPVEDFTGPTIAEIQKFIEITDDARREGEAVGVHCAEGRGRTGVMCACYLIYYYDMEPWDAIRIMRRQRPGSVERKVQEETVVKFYALLQDYGKGSLDTLEKREKELVEIHKRQQAELIRREALSAQQATMNLLHHMHSFHTKQSTEAKQDRVSRIRRAKSMPKMEDEEAMNAAKLKSHLQSFLQGDRAKRSKSQLRRGGGDDSEDAAGGASDTDRRSRATTPATGRSLLEEVSLRPVGERRPLREPSARTAAAAAASDTENCELKNHFRDFMRTPAMVKRGRSFSQPRDKGAAGGGGDQEVEGVRTPNTSLSRKESLNDRQQQQAEAERHELANHTKRFLKRKSMINPNKLSDDSDNDTTSSVVTGRRDNNNTHKSVVDNKSTELLTFSDNDVDNNNSSDSRHTSHHSSPVVLTSKKPPPCKTVTEAAAAQPMRQRHVLNSNTRDHHEEEEEEGKGKAVPRLKAVQRPDRRTRSKSDITVPRVYADNVAADELAADSELPELEPNGVENDQPEVEKEEVTRKVEAREETESAQTRLVTAELTETVQLPRIRKNNLNSGDVSGAGEYVYVSAVTRVANARPKPFVSAAAAATVTAATAATVTAAAAVIAAAASNGHAAAEDIEKNISNCYSRQNSRDLDEQSGDVAYEANSTDRNSHHQQQQGIYSASTTELMNACKSGLRRLTYRKTYARSRSGTAEPTDEISGQSHDSNNNNNNEANNKYCQSNKMEELSNNSIIYTQHSSGSRLPNRPTTPGPYLGLDPHSGSAGLYKRPTTPGPFSRQSWKRTNQKFNYSKFLNYSNHETYV